MGFQLAEAMVAKTAMPPPKTTTRKTMKTKPTTTVSMKKEHSWKPRPMYVQMVLLRRMPSEKLQKHIHYLFGCVSGLHLFDILFDLTLADCRVQ